MTATMFIEQQYPVRKVLRYAGVSASSYYFKPTIGTPKIRGVKPSEFTLAVSGIKIPNSEVVSQVKLLLEKEFQNSLPIAK